MSEMKELWVPVGESDSEKFISNMGRVMLGNKLLKPHNCRGYLRIGMTSKGKRKNYYIHRLVISNFYGNSELHVNHINGDKLDNRLVNLEYVTQKENNRHARDMGLHKTAVGERNNTSKLKKNDVLCMRLIHRVGKYTYKELSEIYGIKAHNTWNIIKRNHWKHI